VASSFLSSMLNNFVARLTRLPSWKKASMIRKLRPATEKARTYSTKLVQGREKGPDGKPGEGITVPGSRGGACEFFWRIRVRMARWMGSSSPRSSTLSVATSVSWIRNFTCGKELSVETPTLKHAKTVRLRPCSSRPEKGVSSELYEGGRTRC
jgi:hypothetical protein